MTEPELIEADRPELASEPASELAGPEQWREQMVPQLLEEGVLVDPAIEAAFRAVPREVFTPADVDPRRVYEGPARRLSGWRCGFLWASSLDPA